VLIFHNVNETERWDTLPYMVSVQNLLGEVFLLELEEEGALEEEKDGIENEDTVRG
jgi:hypothetical protein